MLVVKFFSEFWSDKLIVRFVVFKIVINEVVLIFNWFNDVIMMNSINMVFSIDFKKFISIGLYFDFDIILLIIEIIIFIIIWFSMKIIIVIVMLIFYGIV